MRRDTQGIYCMEQRERESKWRLEASRIRCHPRSELHEYTLGYQRPYPYPYPQGLSTLAKGTVLMGVWGVHPGQGGTRVQATDIDYWS